MVVDVFAFLSGGLVAQDAYPFNLGVDVILCAPSCSSSSSAPRDVDLLGRLFEGGIRLIVVEQWNNFLFLLKLFMGTFLSMSLLAIAS